jgi:hypothetical protein
MLDPIGNFYRIRELYLSYLDTAFRINDPEVAERRRELLRTPGTFCTQPLVEAIPRWRSADVRVEELVNHRDAERLLPSLDLEARRAFAELAMAGLLPSEDDNESPLGRRSRFALYSHQLEMLSRGLVPGRPGIVTSGTGSGKTEAFLLPIFASIAREAVNWPRPGDGFLQRRWWQGTDGNPVANYADLSDRPGKRNPQATPFHLQREGESIQRPRAVRALVLYPMNALVEDQLARLREALDSDEARAVMDIRFNGNRIFFGRYTSATPVTGFHFHPRPDDEEPKRRSRKLQDLFERCTDLQRTQELARAHEDARFLFPSIDGNELTSRWDMQETPPDILVSNLSMLSAMLAREVDEPIFAHTREWLQSHDDACFFLVLDELHLQRGSPGTEMSFLLRLLVERLGLDAPEHRHKLRILASSASLPVEGEPRDRSLRYLWEMFGRMGSFASASDTGFESSDGWVEAIVPGEPLPQTPSGTHRLSPEPFVALTRALSSDLSQPARPETLNEHERELRAVAAALLPESHGDSAPLEEALHACVIEAGERIAQACWHVGERPRPAQLDVLAERLFGDATVVEAVRGLLFVRGLGDHSSIWPGDAPVAPTFRVHLFFRNLEGLFSPARIELAGDEKRLRWGALSIERGVRFAREENGRHAVLLELLYCECCGELFCGGRRAQGRGQTVALMPADPELEGLPETAASQLFEDLSHDRFALFWPCSDREPIEVDVDHWRAAALDPQQGIVRLLGLRSTPPRESEIEGKLYVRDNGADTHHRRSGDRGTAVPYACPKCGTDYEPRAARFRLSPLRNFRAGFAKSTQLLATELFDVLRLHLERQDAKLVSFSDSRQDAAHTALDVERRHHEDIRREALIIALRQVYARRPSRDALQREHAELLESITAAARAGRADEIACASSRLQAVELQLRHADDPAIPLSEIIESTTAGNFRGARDARELLRRFLGTIVELGLHPTDPSGVATFKTELAGARRSFPWYSLFRIGEDRVADWQDAGSAVEQEHFDLARQQLVHQALPLLSETLFSKTYFSLEETGLGYPCLRLGTGTRAENARWDAWVRVFGDTYRLQHDPWGEQRRPWLSEVEIPVRSRLRAFAERVWPGENLRERLEEVLRVLTAAGHPQGLIATDQVFVMLTEPSDPFWRCGNCGRVHLHRGAEICTRCYASLPAESSGTCGELRARHFLAHRVERTGDPFRLRCEELTGQTSDGADRLRRFRGIVLPHGAGNDTPLARVAREIDMLAVTTTMEVGIDIGPLQAIFDANMPPQRFNYQQRVGRAGRAGQAFSMVLTVCRSKSHDLYYFREAQKITGDDPPPPFISKRHDAPVLRFVRKAWLAEVFRRRRDAATADGRPFAGDAIEPPDIHGEFMPLLDLLDNADEQARLESDLENTLTERDRIASLLCADSDLDAVAISTQLTPQRILNEIREIERTDVRERGLAHSLAEAGHLPMFGMPTRVRDLYLKIGSSTDGRMECDTMDRDLDIAVHEFAPGSVLVKDKLQHRCVGFTGPLRRDQRVHSRDQIIEPLSDAFRQRFDLVQCSGCGAWKQVNGAEQNCQGCGRSLPTNEAHTCVVPAAFRTDFHPRSVEEEEVVGQRHRSILAEAESVVMRDACGSGLLWAENRARTFRLNRGPSRDVNGVREYAGFTTRLGSEKVWVGNYPCRLVRQHVESDSLARSFDPDPIGGGVTDVWIAAPKTTDAIYLAPAGTRCGLRLSAVERDPANTAVRASALSAVFLLVQRAALELDVDPEEFDVIDPRPIEHSQHGRIPLLQFTDFLVNGSGYCEELASTDAEGVPRIVRILHSIVADRTAFPLSQLLAGDHPERCDQACYLCLHRYGNQMYHGLLDWRLGLAFLRCIADVQFDCGLEGEAFADDPALADWPRLCREYAERQTRGMSGSSVEEYHGLTAFSYDAAQNEWALIAHPLWDAVTPQGRLARAREEMIGAGRRVEIVDTFELARRPTTVREKLYQAWRR